MSGGRSALFTLQEREKRDDTLKTAVKEDVMAIDKELLDILACPKCKGDIRLSEENNGLICDACKLLYPIRDDIPVMLIDEAEALE